MKRILIALLTLMSFSSIKAEKVTVDQFNSKLSAYSTILKDANAKYEQALAADNKKEVVYQYCRRLGIYHKAHTMAKDNPQIATSAEVLETMEDILKSHLRPIKAQGLTEEQFCAMESKL